MASDGAKIAWAIIAAAIIIVAGVVGYFEYTKWEIGEAARRASERMEQERTASALERMRKKQEADAAERKAQQSRWLRPPERCIGGKVMLPAPDGKVGWVMQLERGQPVRCGGMDSPRPYRLKPRPLADQ